MKRKKTYIKIVICILFLAAAVIFTIVSMEYEPSDSTRQWYQILGAICIAGALMCVFGEDGAKGLKKAAQNFRSFFQGFAKPLPQIKSFSGSWPRLPPLSCHSRPASGMSPGCGISRCSGRF